jgi:hypothetical protein
MRPGVQASPNSLAGDVMIVGRVSFKEQPV